MSKKSLKVCPFCGKRLSRLKCRCCKDCRGKIYTGKNAPKWKGGQRIRNGYVYVYFPEHSQANTDGYIKRSHVVLEKKLGRVLTSQDNVHHVNGNKQDDSIDNLMVFSNSNHRKYHSWAYDYLVEIGKEIEYNKWFNKKQRTKKKDEE